MNPAFVLDCSVAMAWCFADEAEPYTEAVLDRLEKEAAIVPALWRLETANVLLTAERRKRITRAESMRLAMFLSELPIADDTESITCGLSRVLDLGRDHGISAYDAAYLELAIRLGLPLATLDQLLRQAAQAAGVPLV